MDREALGTSGPHPAGPSAAAPTAAAGGCWQPPDPGGALCTTVPNVRSTVSTTHASGGCVATSGPVTARLPGASAPSHG
jgi:hypothetical protein